MLTAWDSNGFRCTVHFPGLLRERWEFDRITDPYLLFNAIEVFTNKLQTAPTYPMRVAKELFTGTLGPAAPQILTDAPEKYWSVFIDKMETEFIWQRKLTAAEKKMDFVHAFDKRMMFLSAARGGMFGRGHWEIVEHCKYEDLGGAVGIVKLKKPKFENAMFPDFAKFLKELFGKTETFFTPYLSVFENKERSWINSLEIEKGFIWRKPERLFEKYSVKLGNAIKDTRSDSSQSRVTREELDAANASFKQCYTQFIGWLGRTCECENCNPRINGPETGEFIACKRQGFGAELFRPDWRGLIVAGAGANLLRNIWDVYFYTKKLPFAINHDCIMYFSDAEQWEMDFAKTPVADPLKFTHEWTAPADKVLAAIAEGLNPAQLEKAVQNGN